MGEELLAFQQGIKNYQKIDTLGTSISSLGTSITAISASVASSSLSTALVVNGGTSDIHTGDLCFFKEMGNPMKVESLNSAFTGDTYIQNYYTVTKYNQSSTTVTKFPMVVERKWIFPINGDQGKLILFGFGTSFNSNAPTVFTANISNKSSLRYGEFDNVYSSIILPSTKYTSKNIYLKRYDLGTENKLLAIYKGNTNVYARIITYDSNQVNWGTEVNVGTTTTSYQNNNIALAIYLRNFDGIFVKPDKVLFAYGIPNGTNSNVDYSGRIALKAANVTNGTLITQAELYSGTYAQNCYFNMVPPGTAGCVVPQNQPELCYMSDDRFAIKFNTLTRPESFNLTIHRTTISIGTLAGGLNPVFGGSNALDFSNGTGRYLLSSSIWYGTTGISNTMFRINGDQIAMFTPSTSIGADPDWTNNSMNSFLIVSDPSNPLEARFYDGVNSGYGKQTYIFSNGTYATFIGLAQNDQDNIYIRNVYTTAGVSGGSAITYFEFSGFNTSKFPLKLNFINTSNIIWNTDFHAWYSDDWLYDVTLGTCTRNPSTNRKELGIFGILANDLNNYTTNRTRMIYHNGYKYYKVTNEYGLDYKVKQFCGVSNSDIVINGTGNIVVSGIISGTVGRNELRPGESYYYNYNKDFESTWNQYVTCERSGLLKSHREFAPLTNGYDATVGSSALWLSPYYNYPYTNPVGARRANIYTCGTVSNEFLYSDEIVRCIAPNTYEIL